MYESVMTLAATDEKEPVCIMTIMASTWGKHVKYAHETSHSEIGH